MPTVDNLGVAHVCAKRLWRHIEPIQFECSRNAVPTMDGAGGGEGHSPIPALAPRGFPILA